MAQELTLGGKNRRQITFSKDFQGDLAVSMDGDDGYEVSKWLDKAEIAMLQRFLTENFGEPLLDTSLGT
jgi:hypothetical protein